MNKQSKNRWNLKRETKIKINKQTKIKILNVLKCLILNSYIFIKKKWEQINEI